MGTDTKILQGEDAADPIYTPTGQTVHFLGLNIPITQFMGQVR